MLIFRHFRRGLVWTAIMLSACLSLYGKNVSPYDYGLGQAKNGEERYWALYNAHVSALEQNVQVDYSNIGQLDIEIPEKVKSIPLGERTDFRGLVLNVENNNKDKFILFTLIRKAKDISIDKAALVSYDFSSYPELSTGVKLLIVQDNTDLKFKGMDDNLYNVHRRDVDFSRVNSLQLFKTADCKDVRIRKIDAVPLVENALDAPTITLGSASVTFQDTLQRGEYIEYYAGEKTAQIYDSLGNSRTVKVSRRGRFRVPHGVYQATVSGASELKEAPSEVVLTFGMYGQFIKN